MKKILNLLSVMTISATAIPTIIAASPYQKQENKLESKDTVLQINNIEKLNRVKRNIDNNFGLTKILVKDLKDHSYEINVDFVYTVDNKLYITHSSEFYEYNPTTTRANKLFNITSEINSSPIVFNNKLYLVSMGNFFEYNFATKNLKKIAYMPSAHYSSLLTFNNKFYIANDGNLFEYDPATEQQKTIVRTNYVVTSSGIVLNNRFYFSWELENGNIYEYLPVVEKEKFVTTNELIPIQSSLILFNNKIYFFPTDDRNGNHELYEYDPATNQQKTIVKTNVHYSSLILFNNKLYFISRNNLYEYNLVTKTENLVISTNNNIHFSSLLTFNNKLYFTSSNNLYEYNIKTKRAIIIIQTKNNKTSVKVFNNKLYFTSKNSKYFYEYGEKHNLNKIITNFNLNLINANDEKEISDEAILNELNYCNQSLDISQLKVVNKNRTFAIIKAKNMNGKYFGEKKIFYKVNNEDNKNIYLRDLIKKAIFFKFRDDDNHNLEFSKIKNINLSYLQYSNIELKETIEPKIDIKDYYISECNGGANLRNNTSNIQQMKTSECSISDEVEKKIQLSNGLIKSKTSEQGTTSGEEQSNSSGSSVSNSNTKSSELVDAFEEIDIKQSSKSSGWHAELSVNAQAGFNIGFASGSVSTTYSGGYNSNSETSQSHSSGHTNSKSTGNSESNQKEEIKTTIITNNSSSSSFNSNSKNVSLEKNESNAGTKTIKFTWPSQDVKVSPKTKVIVNFIIKKITGEIVLDLNQDISGSIIVKVENKNGEEEIIDFSIGELMQKLIQYKLLSPQISISEYDKNAVYFEGQIRFLIKNTRQEDINFQEIKLD